MARGRRIVIVASFGAQSKLQIVSVVVIVKVVIVVVIVGVVVVSTKAFNRFKLS